LLFTTPKTKFLVPVLASTNRNVDAKEDYIGGDKGIMNIFRKGNCFNLTEIIFDANFAPIDGESALLMKSNASCGNSGVLIRQSPAVADNYYIVSGSSSCE
jgi:hypothetical protein